MDSEAKLSALVPLLKAKGLSALIVPSEDAHQSEYTSEKDQRRAWVSEFTGSAGIALVYLDKKSSVGAKGNLWTDSRYFLQAEAQMDAKFWKLYKAHTKGVFTLQQRLIQLSAGKNEFKVGIDFRFVKYLTINRWRKMVEDFSVVFVDAPNLIDEIRQYKEPEETLAKQAVFHHKLEYSGEPVDSKLGRIRQFIEREYKVKENYAILLSDLSEICWLLNLRGRNMIDCCPLFFGYGILTDKQMILFSDLPDGTEEEVKGLEAHFTQLKEVISFRIESYESFEAVLQKELVDKKVFVQEALSYKHYSLAQKVASEVVREKHNVISQFKAIKNETEIEQMRETSIEDSVAMCRYLHWLETHVTDESELDEVDVADVLEGFRREGKDFDGLSFPTISSYGSNGAIIHYQPAKGNTLLQTVGTDSLYLVDSGGQYKSGGTTDVTRTVIIGAPTPEMRKYFTLVLEGHIQLANHTLKPNTTLLVLDRLARAPLMKEGANYGHGTSHGVGTYLNVHEMPVGRGTDVIMKGMCFSNEPGFYKDGEWGIRIESVVVAVPLDATSEDLRLETLNYIPIQTKLIDKQYLSEPSRKWLNDYHRDILKIVGPLLKKKGFDDVHAWLKKATVPL